jgi:hypothetical protein
MNPHIGLALVGLIAFVFPGLVAYGAEVMLQTRGESSLLQFRRLFARRIGRGWWDRLGQSKPSMIAKVWLLRLMTLAALLFTAWHTVSAIIAE